MTRASPSESRPALTVLFLIGACIVSMGARACEREMVLIPAGPAWIGCNPDVLDPFGEPCFDDALPFHQVYLSNFFIHKTEVSFREYRTCVADGVCRRSSFDDDPNLASDDNPVVGVTWNDATSYCEWAGKRLPTEAEWEKAARGTDGRIYPWGNEWEPAFANWHDGGAYDGFNKPAPVISFESTPSPYGLLNMTGNVWEWVADAYDPDYYSHSPSLDPRGPEHGDMKILKGGAWKWDFYETRLRIFYRNWSEAWGLSDHVGFRCAKSLSEE